MKRELAAKQQSESRPKARIDLVSRLLLTLAVVALFSPVLLAEAVGSSSTAGASLELENEMRQAAWRGPMFDLLFGLAIGASAAALFRAYQIFFGRRSSAA